MPRQCLPCLKWPQGARRGSAAERRGAHHSIDMVARNYLEHLTPEGVDPFARAAAAGYRGTGVGENIVSYSSATPRSLFEGWRTSPPHN